MARPALSEAVVAAFRDRLSDLALRRFAEEGYRAVTLRALARELGVSHAMIYRYVADKDDLFAAVRLRAVERFIAYQERRLGAIDDPRAAIRAGARSYVDFAVDEPHAFRVMSDLNQPHMRGYPTLKAAHRRAFRLLEDIVARALAAGVLDGDAVSVTQELWAATHGVAALYVAGQLRSRRAAQGLALSLAEALLAGRAPSQSKGAKR